MKIIFVLNHFLPNRTAGTEIYTWALCKQLQLLGVDVKIVIPHYKNKESFDYIYDDLQVHQFAEPSIVDRSLIMGFRSPEGLHHFDNYLQNQKPDIVHFHEIAGSNGITLKHIQSAKKCNAKVIMTFHLAGYSCKTGTLVHQSKNICDGVIDLQKCSICHLSSSGYKILARPLTMLSTFLHNSSINTAQWQNKLGTALGTVSLISNLYNDLDFISECDHLVSITQWYKKVLLANGVNQSKVSVITQGLPFDNYHEVSIGKSNFTPLKLVFLGRINKLKGLHLLIKALEGIDPSLVKLSIFGISDDNLDYENDLRIKTKEMKNVSWKGKLKQEEVIITLVKHDMLCLCSTFSEMSPLVIQEAFAARIPVLASNVYGNSEQILHNHNGLLFQFDNSEDLRNQIVRCITEPYLLQSLIKNISPPKSFKTVGKEYYELYKHLLN